MKKFIKLLFLLVFIGVVGGCSSTTRTQAVKYNDIRATFVTSQGDISFYLYPEAAPITVANFINLAKRGFYDNTKIHRAVENFVVQGGDPTGRGDGGPGYAIPDEFSKWLDFYQPGILAMANTGPETGGSQFFFTLYPADWLNNKHTIFGEFIEEKDFNNIKKLEVGDVIKEIKFTGDVDLFLSLHKDQVEEWNKTLDKNFPNLKKYPIKDKSEFSGEVQAYYDELKGIYTKKDNKNTEEKEWAIPRFIRATEKKIKEIND
ncbi:peptidylprolyl isomerase [Cetobacterium sp. 8H]|uniref:peptidylprolyl isomerase n=1 Tax=Cetobacterium sp. 8H TaxID=2759681 RepID=UPI00163C1B85|nr:peptidylprolyl isomerase [Cetobacterium sp. 8H]MBC2850491.1 peptidylprolyl isomerase [Cetobacterium sp. 8H]